MDFWKQKNHLYNRVNQFVSWHTLTLVLYNFDQSKYLEKCTFTFKTIHFYLIIILFGINVYLINWFILYFIPLSPIPILLILEYFLFLFFYHCGINFVKLYLCVYVFLILSFPFYPSFSLPSSHLLFKLGTCSIN